MSLVGRLVGARKRRWFASLAGVVLMGTGVVSELDAAEYLVSDRATSQVLRFDTAGQYLGSFVGGDMASNGGLFMPTAMTYAFDGDLFVTSFDLQTGDGRVLRYDGDSGNFLGTFASGLLVPAGLLYHSASDTLLVGSLGANLGDSNQIVRLTSQGTRLSDIAAGPVSGRTGMVSTAEGDLYVSSFADGPFFTGAVLAYDWDSASGDFAYRGPLAGNMALAGAQGLAMDGAGDLYVASLFGQSVIRFDMRGGVADAGTVLNNAAYPSGILAGPGEELLVTSLGNNNPNDPIYPMTFPGSVYRFNRQTGAMVGQGPFLSHGNEFQPTAILVRGVEGDLDHDGQLTALDIDALTQVVRRGSNISAFDLNGDKRVDDADRAKWVEQLKRTYYGDADLDGQFNSSDLVRVFEVGEYEDAVAMNSWWSDGDWDGDGDFTSGDLVVAFQAGAYEKGPRPAVAAVPEPTGLGTVLAGVITFLAAWRRSSRA